MVRNCSPLSERTSGDPSRLKSSTIQTCLTRSAKYSWGAWNVPSPLPRNNLIPVGSVVLGPPFPMKSNLPSKLKSPARIFWRGFPPVLISVPELNVPFPFPGRISAFPSSSFSTMMSRFPLPRKSPRTTPPGNLPTARFVGAWNVPSPFPRNVLT